MSEARSQMSDASGAEATADARGDVNLVRYENDYCTLLLPDGAGWKTAHLRRTYSARNVVRSRGGLAISAVTYPRSKAGGEYKDGAEFLARTQRLPGDIVIDHRKRPQPLWQTRYTDRRRDRYYALIEGPAALLEIDCVGPCGRPPPPIEAITASARFIDPPVHAAPAWQTVALSEIAIDVPTDWVRKDEYNRPLTVAGEAHAHGLSVAQTSAVYTTRQMSPPQYRVQPLETGRNLRAYLVGLKTERHKSSIDGAMYQFLGEDTIRGKHVGGTRLRYQGYSPQGIRGPLEWYHELLLVEMRDAPLLISAYCDWIERGIFRPLFARMTTSLAPR